MRMKLLLLALLTGAAWGQVIPGGVRYVLVAPSGACIAGSPITQVVNGAGTVYACQSISSGAGTWTALASGSATGTVTSIGLVGTANQITITGSSPITASGSWTLSLPSAVTMPGTLNVTGNLTTNLTGTALCVQETNGVLSAAATGCGGAGFPGAGIGLSTGSAWGTSLTAFGSAVGVATTSDPGTTAEVPMVANGTHGTKPSASGALQTGAFTAAYVLPAATSSVLGGVKPDGTSVLNTAGAISVTPTSIGLGNVTNNAQVTSVTGTANQIAVSGTTTPTLSITSPFNPPGNVNLASGNVLSWNSDTGCSRDSAGVIDCGNGTQGDKSGTIKAANANFSSGFTIGAGADAVLGTSSNAIGIAAGSGTMAGTAGYFGLRGDLATGKWVMITPSGSEYNPPIGAAIVPQSAGGTGINNTSTLTLGSSNVNLASQASGVVYNTTTTGALTAANFHQISGPMVCTDTSASATAFTCTGTPSLASLTTGDLINFCGINQANSGAATITVNGSSAIPIKKWQNTALVANDMLASKCVLLRYDGTNFELDTIGNQPGGAGTVTVVGAGNLTSTALVTGGGTQTLQTPSATSTLDASGNVSLAAGGSLKSADTGTPGFTFATNKITANQPFTFGTTSNQIVTGTTTNLTTLTFPASSGAITLTFPLTSQLMLGGNSDTTTTHVAHATAVAGVVNFAAIAAGDLPAALSSSTSINGLAITASTGTLAVTNAKTASFSNTLTFAGTDSTTMTFPGASATVAGLGTTQTFTGVDTFTPAARSSGTASYFTLTTPADTGITTATESIGDNHVAGTRTWVDGTVATQREHLFAAPTYNKTTTSATFTKAATLAVSAAPIAGTGVTITNPYAFWVQAGSAQFDGGLVSTTGNFTTGITCTAATCLGSATATTQSAKDNSTKVATTAYVDAATPLTTGTSVTLTTPRQYFVCTGTCTITAPVPAAGMEFCVMNDDNVATVITFSAIGSSARYENTARTAYGTAGTGTLVSGGAAGDKMCLLGRDSTHYLVASYNGTWTAN